MDHNNHNINNSATAPANKEVFYVCPMCPGVREGKPGNCPNCGMALIVERETSNVKRGGKSEHGSSERDKHSGHSPEMFSRKFWLSLILTIPVVAYSDLPGKLFGWSAPGFTGSQFVPILFGSVVFFYGGWVFITGAWHEIRSKLPGMMTLITMAISVAYLYSIYDVFTGEGEHTLFWELTTLIAIMLLGHWIEMRAVQGVTGALKELAKLLPDTAEIVRGDKTEIVFLSDLQIHDSVFVRPGGKVSADGTVISGSSEVNESMITGESKPVQKNMGSEVIAGTVNGDGALTIRVTKIGEHTFLAGVMRLVAEAQSSKSKIQILSDKAAFYLTFIALGAGTLTFVAWLMVGGDVPFSLERLVAVLVIACPHALGLAVPLVASISTTLAAKQGFLVRQRLALEAAKNATTVLFDKTGTLTKGEYSVLKVMSVGVAEEKDVLALAASVDRFSEHFAAKAIVKEAAARGLGMLDVTDFQRIPGSGVAGNIDGARVMVGGESIFADIDANPYKVKSETELFTREGKTIIFVIKDRALLGVIVLGDMIREESKNALRDLRSLGIKVAMLTGDSEDVAIWVSRELGLDKYFARVSPQNKAEIVKRLQGEGEIVAMVGDGINDAPALTQADLGIAIGAGTNVAIESAGIILMKNDPRDIVKIIRLSKATHRKMIQNLLWATGYNIVAMPLAAGVLYFQGIVLTPAVSAVLMSLSTVVVAVNAMTMKRAKI